MKNRLLKSIVILSLFGILSAIGVARAQLVAGQDYRIINPPMPTDQPGVIEVTEFFSYACPHCYKLNPAITNWLPTLPPDVAFKRMPISGSPLYTTMARLYYALEAIGEAKRLENAVFDALHDKNLRIFDEESITKWVVSQNVDAKKFGDAFNAFGVDSQLRRAEQLRRNAGIDGVPAIVVDGRYQVITQRLKSYDDFLAVTNQLIARRRNERKQAGK